MAAVTVRNLDAQVKERLRIRAAVHGRSMESEIRAILAEAVSRPGDTDGLFATILDRFAKIGGVELELPERSTPVRSPDLSA
jgi:antitoxin FitA